MTPSITDWLMVGITVVYVVATIFICHANFKSATASKEQVEESKRQFEDTKRLGMMPYLQFSLLKSSEPLCCELNLVLSSSDDKISDSHYNNGYHIKIKNIGNGTAKNILYKWKNFTDVFDRGCFPIQAIQSGDEYNIRINFAVPEGTSTILTASIILSFQDLIDNRYTQDVTLEFEYRDTRTLVLAKVFVSSPEFVRKENDKCPNNQQQ